MELFTHPKPEAPSSLGMAIVMSSFTPLVLLDDHLVVKAASRSFCVAFRIDPETVIGLALDALGDGEWNIPQLHNLLDATAHGMAPVESYEIDLKRPGQPTRRLLTSAHVLDLGDDSEMRIIMAVSDLTDAIAAERIKDDLVLEKQTLMRELQHRVANSLQIIASVLMLSARSVKQEESRSQIRDAHHRVLSIAALQRQLASTGETDVALAPYFSELCRCIGASMISDPALVQLVVTADDSSATSDRSVSLGLIVTELVINSLKHAFPVLNSSGRITVDYNATATGWTLVVADDGVGMGSPGSKEPGLGTGIVNALAKQLNAQVTVTDAGPGTCVTIVHG
jgi:two-component system, sensor histidine kinase PdtaS